MTLRDNKYLFSKHKLAEWTHVVLHNAVGLKPRIPLFLSIMYHLFNIYLHYFRHVPLKYELYEFQHEHEILI